MQNAINEILSKTATKTADYTYADATLTYSENITAQTTIEAKLNNVLSFCDHAGYLVGNVLHVVDLVDGGLVIALPKEKVIKITSKIDTSIVSTLKASYNYREHDTGDVASAPTLTNESRDIILSTGLDGGVEKDISNKTSAAIVDTGAIVYDDTNINTLLTRKKTLLLKDQVTILADGFLSYNIGNKITFDTTYQSGHLIIESISYNEDNLQTTLYGRGEYIGKAI